MRDSRYSKSMYWIRLVGVDGGVRARVMPFCFSSCIAVVLPSKGDLVAGVKRHHFRVMSSS
jgi:hypothetical protein